MPVDLRVAGDDRLARFRQPTFKASPIQKRATIAVTGRRHGLCASVTRTVSFGPVDARVPRRSLAGHDGRRHLHLLLPPGRGGLRGLPPGQADLREVRPSPRMDPRLPGEHHRLFPPRGRPAARQQPGPRARHGPVLEPQRPGRPHRGHRRHRRPRLRGRHRAPGLARDRGRRQGLHHPPPGRPRALPPGDPAIPAPLRRARHRPRIRSSRDSETNFPTRPSKYNDSAGGMFLRRKDNDSDATFLETRSDRGDRRLRAPDFLADLVLSRRADGERRAWRRCCWCCRSSAACCCTSSGTR